MPHDGRNRTAPLITLPSGASLTVPHERSPYGHYLWPEMTMISLPYTRFVLRVATGNKVLRLTTRSS
jgi:hypothetical protein